jgi:hypothetical protein
MTCKNVVLVTMEESGEGTYHPVEEIRTFSLFNTADYEAVSIQ